MRLLMQRVRHSLLSVRSSRHFLLVCQALLPRHQAQAKLLL